MRPQVAIFTFDAAQQSGSHDRIRLILRPDETQLRLHAIDHAIMQVAGKKIERYRAEAGRYLALCDKWSSSSHPRRFPHSMLSDWYIVVYWEDVEISSKFLPKEIVNLPSILELYV